MVISDAREGEAAYWDMVGGEGGEGGEGGGGKRRLGV